MANVSWRNIRVTLIAPSSDEGEVLAAVGQAVDVRRSMYRRWQTAPLITALLCVLMTACIKWPDAEVSSTQPDKFLFERAMSAVERDRFDVANLTLQTLINTYPDSEYASKAKEALQDPRMANCGESWTIPACDSIPEVMEP